MDEAEYYQDLDAHRREAVPVVGAGLGLAAGAPSFAGLVDHLTSRAAEAGTAGVASGGDPFAVVDQLADALSEEWVQQTTAELVQSCELVPTPALFALSKVAGRLVVTTNYDCAIERAAEEAGLSAMSLTVADLHVALGEPGDALRVLHLHGTADDPSSIVLTSASYARVWGDERVRLLLRDLAVRFRLVFLGHRLDPRENHLRRDLRWVSAVAGSDVARHILVSERPDITGEDAQGFREELERDTGLTVMLLLDPLGRFEGTQRTAAVLAGPSLTGRADVAHPVPPDEFDQYYVTASVADLEQMQTDAGQGQYMAEVMFQGETLSDSLDTTVPRLALVAGAGMGKSGELRQIGRRAARPALLQPLTSFGDLDGGREAAVQFVAGMQTARGVGAAAAARLTLDRLTADSYVFLLDALDEVPAPRRRSLGNLLAAVSDQFPQHRYVMTSRAVPELGDLGGFTYKTVVTGHGWLARYLTRRGLTQEMVDAAVPNQSSVYDLLQTPVFAAAVADDIVARRPLPRDPLQLLSDLADRRADPDRVGARPELLCCWLDRLALLMQIVGVSAFSREDLTQIDLHSDLPGLAPTPEVLQHLASRALLTDTEDTVRFPANILREARAARYLRDAGSVGLALLQQYALVELPELLDSRQRPVRGIRSGWTNTLELLLPAASNGWRAAVAPYDPTLAARSTPSDAPVAERDAAVWTLWSWYAEHRIWINTADSPSRGDEGGLRRLLRAYIPDGFADALQAALRDIEPAARGNAAAILPDVFDRDRAVAELTRLIADEHSVVRRRAATAAYQLGAIELVDTLVDQAVKDTDETATSTLLMYAIDLAPDDDQAADIALAAAPALQDETSVMLARRIGRTQAVELLRRREPFSSPLLTALVHDVRLRPRPDWTAAEVAALAPPPPPPPAPAPWQGDLRTVLQIHPLAAATARLDHPAGDTLVHDISGLTGAMTATQLEDLAQGLDQQPRPTDADDESAHNRVRALIERLLHPVPPLDEDDPELVDAGQTASITATPAPVPSAPTSEELEAALVEVDRDTASGNGAPAYAVETLHRAAENDTPLTAEQAIRLLQICLRWPMPDLANWLTHSMTAERVDAAHPLLEDLTDPELRNLPRVLPRTYPAAFVGAILDACAQLPPGHPTQLATARLLVRADTTDLLHAWAHTHHAAWLDPLLVEVGDPDAEQRLLQDLNTHLATLAARRPVADLDDRGWLRHVRHVESVDLLVALVKTTLVAGDDQSDTRALHEALTRCAGPGSVSIWQTLANDRDLPPAAAFLHYDRQQATQNLIDETPPATPDDPDLHHAIRELARG